MPRLCNLAATDAPTPGTAVTSAVNNVSTVCPAVIPASRRIVFCGATGGVVLLALRVWLTITGALVSAVGTGLGAWLPAASARTASAGAEIVTSREILVVLSGAA